MSGARRADSSASASLPIWASALSSQPDSADSIWVKVGTRTLVKDMAGLLIFKSTPSPTRTKAPPIASGRTHVASAVHADGLAGHVAGFLRSEERGRRGNVLALADAADGKGIAVGLDRARALHDLGAAQHRGVDRARGNHVGG